MPKATPLQSSFDSGEVSPLIQGRAQDPRYKNGLATCANFYPLLQGPLWRRPGTKNCANIASGGTAHPPLLVPYIYSTSVAYMLEVGNGYIRFFTNNGLVTNPGNFYKVNLPKMAPGWPVAEAIQSNGGSYSVRANLIPMANDSAISFWSTTPITGPAVTIMDAPWVQADLPLLKWVQDKDTLYFFHPNYDTYILKPIDMSGYYWELDPLYYSDGPYLPLNTFQTIGDFVRVTLAPVGTGFSGVAYTTSFTVTGCANNGAGLIRVAVSGGHGFLTGDRVVITGVVGTVEANCVAFGTGGTKFWPINVIDSTHFDLIGSAFVNAYSSAGTANFAFAIQSQDQVAGYVTWNRSFSVIQGSVRYVGVCTYGVTGYYAYAVIYWFTVSLPATTTFTAWQIGVYNGRTYTTGSASINVASMPACGCFHQDRLALSGSPNAIQQIDMSQPGIYNSFAPNIPTTIEVTDDSGIQEVLNSRQANPVRWLSSATQGLLAGAGDSEWVCAPSANYEALTPSNFNAIESSYFGANNSDCVKLANSTLYIQRAKRKVRELNFFFQVGTFRSNDMTELSEHISLPYVTKVVVQKETYPLVWALRSDGVLLTMSYNRDDVSVRAGWARHILGGRSDTAGSAPIVLDMGVIPDPTGAFDQLWMVVQRYTGGGYYTFVEYLTRPFDANMNQEDAYQLDGGSTYDSPVTISGITSANPGVVTATAHGFSNGDTVKINSVSGINISMTDVNGNATISTGVNGKTFVVAGKTTNTFQLHDFNGNTIDLSQYSVYISGGQVRKLITEITGLSWLAQETVGVLADGTWHPDTKINVSGQLFLQYPAAKIQLGYRYNSDAMLLRAEAGAADGTSIGKTRRVFKAAVQLYLAGDMSLGNSFSAMQPVEMQRADLQLADNAFSLFNGIMRENVEFGYDYDNQLCLRMNSPFPGGITSVSVFLEEFDI